MVFYIAVVPKIIKITSEDLPKNLGKILIYTFENL